MGCNFKELWDLDHVDHACLVYNEICVVRCAYKVVAARSNIKEHIRLVFTVYGISVDPLHLMLIADCMTYVGDYKPMNWYRMRSQASEFLKMIYKTTDRRDEQVNATTGFAEEVLRKKEMNLLLAASVSVPHLDREETEEMIREGIRRNVKEIGLREPPTHPVQDHRGPAVDVESGTIDLVPIEHDTVDEAVAPPPSQLTHFCQYHCYDRLDRDCDFQRTTVNNYILSRVHTNIISTDNCHNQYRGLNIK